MSSCCWMWQVFLLHWLYHKISQNLGFYLKKSTACILFQGAIGFYPNKACTCLWNNQQFCYFLLQFWYWYCDNLKTVTFLFVVRLYVSLSKWIPLCCYGWTRLETTTQVLARGSSVGAGLTIARTLTLKKLWRISLPPIHRANVLHRQREKKVLLRYHPQILVPSPRTHWSLPQVLCPLI